MKRIMPSDKEWPSQLGMLEVSPSQLFIESNEPDLSALTAKSIAIVGSRNATPYGLRVAADFAAALAEAGYTIISGGAFGFDAAAHRGALSVGGKTVVVLAGELIALIRWRIAICLPMPVETVLLFLNIQQGLLHTNITF